ncbi:MAG: hypothetical protein QMC90_01870 [Dehalococcoidales bacterium]|nr:hypothetical protein [Dehalococcoidales bacterium]
MLTAKEHSTIYQHAYLPEHLPPYVEGISGAKPYLVHDYLCFTTGNHLIFIGYPLGIELTNAQQAYQSACDRFQPATVAVIAPKLWFPRQTCEKQQEDAYYRFDLPIERVRSEVDYMVRRAAREVQVVPGRFGKEHRELVKCFLSEHNVTQEQKAIFERIPYYLERSETARLLEARRGDGALVAFTITDLGSAEYAFYLFNFRSTKENVPGASDLLFYKMVSLAQSEGKRAINLGLGINPGIRRFKEKWGAILFLPYTSCLVRRHPIELETLAQKL